jgi:hypothetical protein
MSLAGSRLVPRDSMSGVLNAANDHVHIATIATDPMKSDSVGWLNGDLRSPK